ncbi:MAG: hypothetical protein ACLGIV_16035 [Actinomycetes bacterium]
MSDLQCPARFLLVEGTTDADHVLADADDPWGELEALADLHRGRTVRVAVPPHVADLLPAILRPPAHVEVDADGWRAVAGPA